jgi:hypothetical protein
VVVGRLLDLLVEWIVRAAMAGVSASAGLAPRPQDQRSRLTRPFS